MKKSWKVRLQVGWCAMLTTHVVDNNFSIRKYQFSCTQETWKEEKLEGTSIGGMVCNAYYACG